MNLHSLIKDPERLENFLLQAKLDCFSDLAQDPVSNKMLQEDDLVKKQILDFAPLNSPLYASFELTWKKERISRKRYNFHLFGYEEVCLEDEPFWEMSIRGTVPYQTSASFEEVQHVLSQAMFAKGKSALPVRGPWISRLQLPHFTHPMMGFPMPGQEFVYNSTTTESNGVLKFKVEETIRVEKTIVYEGECSGGLIEPIEN